MGAPPPSIPPTYAPPGYPPPYGPGSPPIYFTGPPPGAGGRSHEVGFLIAGVAIGLVIAVVVFFALGAHFGAPSTTSTGTTACSTNTEASIGAANSTGPDVAADSVAVHAEAWAVGATDSVVTKPISVIGGSTLLVFAGFVGASVGGPSGLAVCDSSGDTFFLQTSSSAYSSNHSQEMFVAFDVAGGSTVSIAASFDDTDAAAGGTLSVVDLTSPSPLSLEDLVGASNHGDNLTAFVQVTATETSFVVFSVTGQGSAGPYAPALGETLLATYGYYDTGPWTDGESFGTMITTAAAGPVNLEAGLSAGPFVWDAIAAVID